MSGIGLNGLRCGRPRPAAAPLIAYSMENGFIILAAVAAVFSEFMGSSLPFANAVQDADGVVVLGRGPLNYH